MDLKTIGDKVCKGIATQEEEDYIKDLYRKVLGVAFSACKCQLCDAYFLILKRQKTMSRFKIKKGVCLRVKYGDPRFIRASNITDELAIEHLTNNPSEAKFYDFIPEEFMVNKIEKVEEAKEITITPKGNEPVKQQPKQRHKRK